MPRHSASPGGSASRGQRPNSPYTLSFYQQTKLCLWRGWKRLLGDPTLTVGALFANTLMALVISSIFFNLQMTTSSFSSGVLFSSLPVCSTDSLLLSRS
ncbi:hypothetical protein MCOR02_007843 [Pyricularia oryzae]|nr:hypothetical protein MCOR02_007843 [Pyricularia oryzae]